MSNFRLIDDLVVAFKNYFRKRSNIHDYPTRHVNDLNLTNNKKSFSDHATGTRGPILGILYLNRLKIINL